MCVRMSYEEYKESVANMTEILNWEQTVVDLD